MAFYIDIELSPNQIDTMNRIPATSWFTQFSFKNAESPKHPKAALAENNEMKQAMANDWFTNQVKGKRVLDLFCANGGFSVAASMAGATEVIGVEFSPERVECAEFVASTLPSNYNLNFVQGDVYELSRYIEGKFDFVLCLGGLYHIADPPYVLRQIRPFVKENFILQTAHVLPGPGNRAKFIVRRQDKTAKGLTSIRGGSGTWYYTPGCLRELLLHGGFEIVEERQPPMLQRRRFPWYLANCKPL